VKLNIIPLSWCSAMWQCAIQVPGFVTSRRMSTVSRFAAGVAVASAVHLNDVRPEPLGDLRHVGALKRAGCDDDLTCGDRPPVDFEHESAILDGEPSHPAVQLDRELERFRVAPQVHDTSSRLG
jgi:hypothetical protein